MEGDGKHYQIYTATSGRNLDDYQRLVIAWRNGAPIRLGDVAEITDGPQDLRTLGLFNGSPAVIVLLRKKPGANVIAAVRSEEHTSELQSLMRISYAVFCLKKKKNNVSHKITTGDRVHIMKSDAS